MNAHRKSINATWAKGEPIAFLRANVGYAGKECLIWPFTRNPYGYGSFGHECEAFYAHRWMCEAVRGAAPSAEHQAAHGCNNGAGGCVNPQHIFWKTPLQNSQDKIVNGTTYSNKGRRRNKLTADQVAEIRLIKTVAEQFEAAKRYGVSDSMIRKIKYGKSWQPIKPWKELSDDQIRLIRWSKGTVRAKELAARFDIKPGLVYKIWGGHARTHVPH